MLLNNLDFIDTELIPLWGEREIAVNREKVSKLALRLIGAGLLVLGVVLLMPKSGINALFLWVGGVSVFVLIIFGIITGLFSTVMPTPRTEVGGKIIDPTQLKKWNKHRRKK